MQNIPAAIGLVPLPSRRRARLRKRVAARSGKSGLLADYVNTQNDPFDYAGVKLGYGTWQNTVIASAFWHGTQTVNSDGSIGIIIAPTVQGMMSFNTTGFGTTSWSTFNAINYATIATFGTSMRIVSGGVRAAPMVGSSAAPGMCDTLAPSGVNLSTIISNTPSQLHQSQGAHVSIATYGSTVHLSPTSDDFIRMDSNSYNLGSTTIPNQNFGVILFSGLPAGTLVLIEAVINLEILITGIGNASVTGVVQPTLREDVSTLYPTPGLLRRAAIPHLEPIIVPHFEEHARIMGSSSNIRNMQHTSSALGGALSDTFVFRQLNENNEKENRYPESAKEQVEWSPPLANAEQPVDSSGYPVIPTPQPSLTQVAGSAIMSVASLAPVLYELYKTRNLERGDFQRELNNIVANHVIDIPHAAR